MGGLTTCERLVGAARGEGWVGIHRGFSLVVPAFQAGLPCDARAEVGPWNSLRGLWPLRSNNHGQSDDDARCRVPTSALRFSAPSQAPRRMPPQPLFRPAGGMPRFFFVLRHQRGDQG
ncbi:MAG: hypothetical protein C0487_10550 [Leptothrix sp. (in: Bacteria)]|nr:hypothetical protein [Leptothrix sp. (in: b-proteobacteria)]